MSINLLPTYSAQIARTLLDSFKMLPIIEATQKDKKLIDSCITRAYAAGYFISPECVCDQVFTMFGDMGNNYNSTFYKSWSDIANKSDLELLVDQILHYMSTYGTDYTGETYIPNDNPLNIPYSELTVIPAAPVSVIAEKCYAMACSGIAMSNDMVTAALWAIGSAVAQGSIFDFDKIANRELMARICAFAGILPDNPVEALRVLIYALTGSTLIIKNREAVDAIKNSADSAHELCGMFGLSFNEFAEKFAPVFYRFKPLFLAMKNSFPENNNIINKLRRKAIKLHQPLVKGFFEAVTSRETAENYPITAVANIIENEKNTFKLLRAYSAIDGKLMEENLKVPHVYIVRNGKAHTKPANVAYVISTEQKAWFRSVQRLLVKEIVARVSENMKSRGITDVILPNKVRLACPVSEKLFFGNIPYGSYYDLSGSDNFFGVYWRNEWGTNDFDLSFTTLDAKFGWNGAYRDQQRSLMFSGDMTDANPEAVEMFYASDKVPNGFIKLNRYNGVPGSKAEIFFGQEKITNLKRNYMVNPDNICVRVPIVSTKREQITTLVWDKKAYFIDVKTGNGMVSSDVVSPDALKSLKNKLTNALFIDDILDAAKVNVITTGLKTEIAEAPNILDLRDMDKEKIIGLFTSSQK